ncbi:hypothetical protein BDR26DRAFT_901974 [Obelidium mucronatum]|nr:hypothetical protein BDR26DRAFT_901974 [Obelidium mucronatum]
MESEKIIEIWKMKRIIQNLDSATGSGTSLVSLLIPRGNHIVQTSHLLTAELGAASNIKSRITRQAVISALTSIQQRLKLYSKLPANGLAIFCGKVETEAGGLRQMLVDFESFKPLEKFLYRSRLLEETSKFGFIVMDGHGCLFGALAGDSRDILHKLTVDLPKKHGRGGQSASRFSRLREEKRHNYVRKVAELSAQLFITDEKVNCAGIILAGSAEFKTELGQSNLFDSRLQEKIIKTVDVSYGGENGFNQAIELSQDVLANVPFLKEKKTVQEYFDHIARDSGLQMNRYLLRDASTLLEVVLNTSAESFEKDRDRVAAEMGQEAAHLEVAAQSPLVEWFSERYRDFGASLEFVSNKTPEGSQFVRGFGGIGGILRFNVSFSYSESEDEFE